MRKGWNRRENGRRAAHMVSAKIARVYGLDGRRESVPEKRQPYTVHRHRFEDKYLEKELFKGLRLLAAGGRSQRITRYMCSDFVEGRWK